MIVFLTNGAKTIHIKQMTLDPYFTPYIKINSKQIINLNIRAKTIKHLEENKGESLCLGFGNF